MPRESTKVQCVCQNCGKSFDIYRSLHARGKGRYCSRTCYFGISGSGRKTDPIVRFWSYVNKTETCWLWTGQLTDRGYGVFYDGVKQVRAHRFSYELHVGPIPEGHEIDHVKTSECTHRNCIRPDHLEPVTHQVNVLRGNADAALNAVKTHCLRGHEFTPENTIQRKDGGRECRTCGRARNQAYQRRIRSMV